MVKIENKLTTIDHSDGSGKMAYADLIKTCSDFLPKASAKEGWTKVLSKEAFRVEEAVSKASPGKTFEVEDHDLTLIKKFVIGFGWAKKHQDLVDFEEYIESLSSEK